MYGKALFFVVLVVLGAVLPYLLADEAWLAKMENWLDQPTDAQSADASDSANPLSASHGTFLAGESTSIGKTVPAKSWWNRNKTPLQTDPSPSSKSAASSTSTLGRSLELPRVVGPPGIALEQLLSFQITPDWVRDNWARVTARLADLDLHGLRVPISREEGGLVGSVTYYFDRQRYLQRIVLHGYSSDPREFIQLATTRYGMKRVPNTLSELYAASFQGQVIGALRVDHVPIIKRDIKKRCVLLLELNRQATSYGLSNEFRRILEETREEHSILTPITAPPDFASPSKTQSRS